MLPAAAFVLAALTLGQQPVPPIRGTVTDSISGRPLRLAVIRVAETGASLLSDDDGRFTLNLDPGRWRLDVRRIGYAPRTVAITVSGADGELTIVMTPVAFELDELAVAAAEDPAEAIIRRAIERKNDLEKQLRNYSYDGAVKFVVRNLDEPQDSASSILVITESVIAAHWRRPDRYHERIVARRQSRNVAADRNLVTVGEILNFTRNRIDLGPVQVVSPIADNALDSYRYRILDTLTTDDGTVFRIAILPRSETVTLFTGVIDVIDSTFQVRQLDVGLNSAAEMIFVENLRYRQVLANQGGDRWLPNEVRLTGDIRFKVPFPGLPRNLSFEHLALITGYRFDRTDVPPDAEVRVVVDDQADDADSTLWNRIAAIPLTPAEAGAWTRIDSLERNRSPLRKAWRALVSTALDSTAPDFFHFNRVDGAYFGAGGVVRAAPALILSGNAGFATGTDRFQYGLGADIRLDTGSNLWLWWRLHDETASRPTFPSAGRNGTFEALFARRDPLDYFRERGQTLGVRVRPVLPVEVSAWVGGYRHESLTATSDFSFFGSRPIRPNPPIAPGRLRSLSVSARFDDRPIIRAKGLDRILPAFGWTWARVEAEISDPGFLGSAFSYRRYQVEVQHRRRLGNVGVLTVSGQAGTSSGTLPPQRWFGVDFGDRILGSQTIGFITLGDTTYSGTRSWAVRGHHDFGRRLFAATGIPGIRDLPLTLSIHAGLFRTHHEVAAAAAGSGRVYSEVGFGIGNLTPFLAPFNFGVALSWQTSDFPTRGFRAVATIGN